ncbi:unnamed protein product [Eruca vesicaria subsp. sativa]|uniref:Uncharacterized protein n=1 Tax=Eruca vesicaria subsp. sativa TaxID=29727 RepID=A0ABC8JE41_ERUVS|nr:unnamed protein product [Eruca vesicaria subsp. sativa]
MGLTADGITSDGEVELDIKMQEASEPEEIHEADDIGMEISQAESVEDGKLMEGVEKKQGARRKPIRSLVAGASNKMKTAQMLVSKRQVPKTGGRQGDNSKQGEDKGPLNPKQASSKN